VDVRLVDDDRLEAHRVLRPVIVAGMLTTSKVYCGVADRDRVRRRRVRIVGRHFDRDARRARARARIVCRRDCPESSLIPPSPDPGPASGSGSGVPSGAPSAAQSTMISFSSAVSCGWRGAASRPCARRP